MGSFVEWKKFLFNFVVWTLIFKIIVFQNDLLCIKYIYTSGVLQGSRFVEVFHAAVVSHFMFVSPLTYCAHLSNYQVPSLNTKSFVSPRDLTGQSLIDFQGLALSKNAKSLWFFMFHLFLCVMSDQTWVQSLNPKAFKAVTRQAVMIAIYCHAPIQEYSNLMQPL